MMENGAKSTLKKFKLEDTNSDTNWAFLNIKEKKKVKKKKKADR